MAPLGDHRLAPLGDYGMAPLVITGWLHIGDHLHPVHPARIDAQDVRDGFPGGPPVIEIARVAVEQDQGVDHIPGRV